MIKGQRRPFAAGNLRKLAGWARQYFIMCVIWAPLVLLLTYSAVLVVFVLFGGSR